jgi:hypothetical protein
VETTISCGAIVHNLSLIKWELCHDSISNVAPRYAVDVLLLIPPPHLLQLSHSMKSMSVNKQRKENILDFDPSGVCRASMRPAACSYV